MRQVRCKRMTSIGRGRRSHPEIKVFVDWLWYQLWSACLQVKWNRQWDMSFNGHRLTQWSLIFWGLLNWSCLRAFLHWLDEALPHMWVQHVKFRIVSGFYGFVCTRCPFEIDLFIASHSFEDVVLTTQGSLRDNINRFCNG